MGIIAWAAEGETKTRENPYYMVTAEGEIIITGSPDQEEIIIPAEIDGMPVAGIAENAFLNRNDIEQVTIRSGVRYVGEYAFAGCEMLKAVTLEDGLQYIGKGAFSSDGALEEILIPDSVAFVGENAFVDCTELGTIIFPQTAHVDDYAFEGSRWQELRDEGGFQIRGSCLISARGKKERTLEIPYGVTRTVERPSANGYVHAVVGQNIASIDNTRYDEIILPETVVRLGQGSFNHTKIDRIVLPSSLREIGIFAFRSAILDEVVLPEGLKVIELAAFSDTSLKQVKLPDTLEFIGRCAFSDTPLTEIEIPASVRYIDTGAFEHCSNLSDIRFEEGVSTVSIGFCDYSGLERLQFPESLSVLEGSEFFIPSLKRIYIPKGTSVIDDEKFFRAFVTYEVPVVIYGQRGSRAEEVANAWGMEFVEVASGEEMP
ncbi:MAG: leucine-rich repeat domain-containing protein [Acetatifactor sp.]|nr:leucine-rich repeat domain-containing protein [Acetatifactor sp.]